MTTYEMSIKEGNGLVFKINANSKQEAYETFIQLKQMSEEDFYKLFKVSEVKN